MENTSPKLKIAFKRTELAQKGRDNIDHLGHPFSTGLLGRIKYIYDDLRDNFHLGHK